jgi:hypothetical protein
MIWLASDFPSDSWKSFRSDYFDVSFSSSLRLENTPMRSREAIVAVNLKTKCDQCFALVTCARQFVSTAVRLSLYQNYLVSHDLLIHTGLQPGVDTYDI